jgi:hypothetical protein
MNIFFKLLLVLLSFWSTESFTKPFFIPKQFFQSTKMAKHSFQDFSKSITLADKYFLIQSLVNHIVLHKKDLLYDYCAKNFNYTNISYVCTSSDLDFIIKKHWQSNSALKLYDIIDDNAKLTDCYIKIN